MSGRQTTARNMPAVDPALKAARTETRRLINRCREPIPGLVYLLSAEAADRALLRDVIHALRQCAADVERELDGLAATGTDVPPVFGAEYDAEDTHAR